MISFKLANDYQQNSYCTIPIKGGQSIVLHGAYETNAVPFSIVFSNNTKRSYSSLLQSKLS